MVLVLVLKISFNQELVLVLTLGPSEVLVLVLTPGLSLVAENTFRSLWQFFDLLKNLMRFKVVVAGLGWRVGLGLPGWFDASVVVCGDGWPK